MSRSEMLFSDISVSDLERGIIDKLQREVADAGRPYLEGVSDEEYVKYLVDQYSLGDIEINFESVEATAHEAEIAAERHSRIEFDVRSGEHYRRQVFRYHLPFQGDASLLEIQPNPHSMGGTRASVDRANSEIIYDVVDFYNDADRVSREWENVCESFARTTTI